MGIFVQSCGGPILTGMTCLYISSSKVVDTPALLACLCISVENWSKAVDKPGHLLVVCKFLCSVTLNTLYLSTRKILVQSSGHSAHNSSQTCKARLVSVSSVHVLREYVSNMLVKYILYSHLLWRWTFYKNSQGQIAQVPGDGSLQSLHLSTSSYWRHCVSSYSWSFCNVLWIGSC